MCEIMYIKEFWKLGMKVRRKPMTIIGKPMRQGLKKPLSKVMLKDLFEHSLNSATGHWVLAPSRGRPGILFWESQCLQWYCSLSLLDTEERKLALTF